MLSDKTKTRTGPRFLLGRGRDIMSHGRALVTEWTCGALRPRQVQKNIMKFKGLQKVGARFVVKEKPNKRAKTS